MADGAEPPSPIDDLDKVELYSFNCENRQFLQELITENYAYLVNRINTRDFIPYLMQEQCIRLSDKEEVNHMITTADKASHLLDLVQKKDLQALQKFFEVLEYLYEECFIKITGQKPRPKPDEWKSPAPNIRHSADMLNGIMSTLTGLMNQISQNRDQMCALANKVHTVWEKEQKEDESDYYAVKSRLGHLKDENVSLTVENNLLRQRLKRERTRTKKLTESDRNLIILTQQLREKEEALGKLRTQMALRSVISALQSPGAVGNEKDERIEALNKQLQEYLTELSYEKEEKKKQGDQLDELERSNDGLNSKINKLVEEKRTLQTKVDELESSLYWSQRELARFGRQHEQEGQYDNTQRPGNNAGAAGNESIYASANEISGGPVHIQPVEDIDYYMTKQSPVSPGVTMRERSFENEFVHRLSSQFECRVSLQHQQSIEQEPSGYYRQHTLQLTQFLPRREQPGVVKHPSIISVEIVADNLSHNLQLEGGNNAGIFIAGVDPELKAKCRSSSQEVQLQKGDQLVKAKYLGRSVNDTRMLGDCTLEEACSAVNSLRGQVELYTWRKKDAFQKFHNHVTEDYKGDLFCIYIHEQPAAGMGDQSSLQPAAGDVLLVTDTMSNYKNMSWKARKLDPKTGTELQPPQQGFIPSLSHTKVGSLRRVPKESSKKYSYVQPVTANYTRPVLICADYADVVTKVMAAIRDQPQFEVAVEIAANLIQKISDHPKKVIVMQNQESKVTTFIKSNIYPIVLAFNSDVQRISKTHSIPQYIIVNVQMQNVGTCSADDMRREVLAHVDTYQHQIIWMEKDRPCLPRFDFIRQ